MTKIKYFLAFALFILIGVSSVSANEITGSCYYTSDYGTVKIDVENNNIKIESNVIADFDNDGFVFGCREDNGNFINKSETPISNGYCQMQIDYNDFIAGCPSMFYYILYTRNTFPYNTNIAYGTNQSYHDAIFEEDSPTVNIEFKLDSNKSTLSKPTEESRPSFNCKYVDGYNSNHISLTLGVYDSEYSAAFLGDIRDNLNWNNGYTIALDKSVDEVNSCSDLPSTLYAGMDGDKVKITSKKQEGYIAFVTSNNYTTSYEDLIAGSIWSGSRFKYYLSEWQTSLKALMGVDTLTKYTVFDKFRYDDSYDKLCKDKDCGGPESAYDKAMLGARNLANYCSNIYNMYANEKNWVKQDVLELRVRECIDFEDTYKQLAEDNILYDLTSDCGFMTSSLKEKIEWVLNVIKIAGPILALGLGMFDFFKTIAAGDAEKEMKNTFKKFMIRIASAVLLLIVPIIISFLLDLFLEDKDGYDPNNPFCGLVKWDEIK